MAYAMGFILTPLPRLGATLPFSRAQVIPAPAVGRRARGHDAIALHKMLFDPATQRVADAHVGDVAAAARAAVHGVDGGDGGKRRDGRCCCQLLLFGWVAGPAGKSSCDPITTIREVT